MFTGSPSLNAYLKLFLKATAIATFLAAIIIAAGVARVLTL